MRLKILSSLSLSAPTVLILVLQLLDYALCNIIDLAHQIDCATDRSALDFNDYGCWCGLGGVGTPVDNIDACCRSHDHCYDAIVAAGKCNRLSEYIDGYTFNCDHHKPVCDKEANASDECAAKLCTCDVTLALCLAKHEHEYDEKRKCNDNAPKNRRKRGHHKN